MTSEQLDFLRSVARKEKRTIYAKLEEAIQPFIEAGTLSVTRQSERRAIRGRPGHTTTWGRVTYTGVGGRFAQENYAKAYACAEDAKLILGALGVSFD